MSHTEGKIYIDPTFPCFLHDEEGFHFADLHAANNSPEVNEANALRMERCWNEHDDLVKERDELVRVLRDFFLNGYSAGRIEKIGDLLSKYPEAS
jgi:hypothetical protein